VEKSSRPTCNDENYYRDVDTSRRRANLLVTGNFRRGRRRASDGSGRLLWTDATALATAIRRRETTARAALEQQLELIETENSKINAVVASDWPAARAQADAADAALAKGLPIGPLHGVGITVKVTIDVEGMTSTAGSNDLVGRIARRDAVAVARLRSAGAIVVGRTNSPAYAWDAQTDSELYGRTNNPWDLGRTPGGSSGGPAAAVAAGFSPLDLGSDAGGSLRIPAHCCGVVAHKPTYGVVPTLGHVPPPPGSADFPGGLNVIGPIARSVRDLTLAMRSLAGVPETSTAPTRRLHIGWSAEFGTRSGAGVRNVSQPAVASLRAAGHTTTELVGDEFDVLRAGEIHERLIAACAWSWFRVGTEPTFRDLSQLIHDQLQSAEELDRALAGFDAWMLPILPVTAPPHREHPPHERHGSSRYRFADRPRRRSLTCRVPTGRSAVGRFPATCHRSPD
jgi:amidase